MPIKISDIKEGSRARKDYKGIDSLALSIQENGLAVPIALTNDMRLIWGGRRLMAIKQLEWETIPDEYVVFKGDLSEFDLRKLELLENTERDDLHWQEEVAAKAHLDELMKEEYGDSSITKNRGDWSTRKSAALVGESSSNFSEDITLHKAVQEIPELAKYETKAEARRAFNKMFTKHERDVKLKEAEQSYQNRSIKYASDHFSIRDGLEALREMQPTHAYFAEVDPPYAVDLDQHAAKKKSRAKAEHHQRYTEISKKEYPKFCKEVATELYRVLGEDAWVVWWFGYEWYSTIYDILTKVGFKVDSVPLVWYKEKSSTNNPNPKYLLSRDYEQAFLCRKGNVTVEKSRGSMFIHQGVSSISRTCSAEKPVSLYEEIIDTLLPKGVKCVGIIPFLGSGNCLRALYKQNHTGIGWDLDEENRKYFLSKVMEDQEGA